MVQVIKVLIADDHPLILRGITELMSATPDIRVVAHCSDGEQALRSIRELNPDIAVLDIIMPGRSGLEVLEAIHDDGISTRVIFLSAAINSHDIMRGMAEGSYGFVLKESEPAEILDCIRSVAAGQKRLPFEVLARTHSDQAKSELPSLDKLLTEREWKVMACAAAGMSNKEIARKLKITEGTAKIHLHNIYQKTGVNNRTALTSLAFHHLDRINPTS